MPYKLIFIGYFFLYTDSIFFFFLHAAFAGNSSFLVDVFFSYFFSNSLIIFLPINDMENVTNINKMDFRGFSTNALILKPIKLRENIIISLPKTNALMYSLFLIPAKAANPQTTIEGVNGNVSKKNIGVNPLSFIHLKMP